MHFDEPLLVDALDRIAPELRAAFAASCAERLFPAFLTYFDQSGRGRPGVLRRALDRLWGALLNQPISASDLSSEIDACMSEIPQEDQGSWSPSQAYAEDAAAAACYGLRALGTGDSREAAWAARRAFEALDHFVISRADMDFSDRSTEVKVLGDPLVQEEIRRQRRDLETLLEASSRDREARAAIIEELRAAASSEAMSFLGSPVSE